MTFEKWWKENQNEIDNNISCQNFTGIKEDFEACWHDGYIQGRHLTRQSSGRAESCDKYPKTQGGDYTGGVLPPTA